jgi:isoaspartyl peptidase/L-asparaginase-like protein (Ntn-hydrolase superfamily)
MRSRSSIAMSNRVLRSSKWAPLLSNLKGLIPVCCFESSEWQKRREVFLFVLSHSVASVNKKFGTVGAVALDAYGNLAAATSTGVLYLFDCLIDCFHSVPSE